MSHTGPASSPRESSLPGAPVVVLPRLKQLNAQPSSSSSSSSQKPLQSTQHLRPAPYGVLTQARSRSSSVASIAGSASPIDSSGISSAGSPSLRSVELPYLQRSVSPALSSSSKYSPQLRSSISTPRLQAEAGISFNDVASQWRQPVGSSPADGQTALRPSKPEVIASHATLSTSERTRTPPHAFYEHTGTIDPTDAAALLHLSGETRGLGLSLSKPRLHDIAPINTRVRSPTPDSGTSSHMHMHIPLGPTLRSARSNAHFLGALRSRMSPEPSSSSHHDEGAPLWRSNTNLRRLFRMHEENGPRSRTTSGTSQSLMPSPGVVASPTPSPLLAHDSPDMPNPYATPESVAAPAFRSSDENRGERHRRYVLTELAETERSYASDMNVIKNLYLAQARLRSGIRPTTPSSSSSLSLMYASQDAPSSRTQSVSSEPDPEVVGAWSSANPPTFVSPSSDTQPENRPPMLMPPMPGMSGGASAPLSVTDIHVIFAGVEACVTLATDMADLLAAAARNERPVSGVFLEKMPLIEQVFALYCARHEASIARLADVTTRSPAAAAFLRDCDDLSRQHSTAWDLPSLLIKPVQRVLKYPLFLQSILECTDPSDPEYAQLQQALEQIQGVADRINESKKRMDIVGQHGFGLPSLSRTGFRRPVAPGGLRRAKTPTVDGPLTEDEDRFRALVARLNATEHTIRHFTQHCAMWMQNMRAMYTAEVRMIDEWIAVYACSDVHEPASLERLKQFRGLIHWRILNQACAQLETSLHRSVYVLINSMLILLERTQMVLMNRSAKEGEYRRYLHERARRPNTKVNAGALAFLSMHMQLVDEIPLLLRGTDFVMQRCILSLIRLQRSFYGLVGDILRDFCVRYIPSVMTPSTASPVTTSRMPDMLPSPADTSAGFDAPVVPEKTSVPSSSSRRYPTLAPPPMEPFAQPSLVPVSAPMPLATTPPPPSAQSSARSSSPLRLIMPSSPAPSSPAPASPLVPAITTPSATPSATAISKGSAASSHVAGLAPLPHMLSNMTMSPTMPRSLSKRESPRSNRERKAQSRHSTLASLFRSSSPQPQEPDVSISASPAQELPPPTTHSPYPIVGPPSPSPVLVDGTAPLPALAPPLAGTASTSTPSPVPDMAFSSPSRSKKRDTNPVTPVSKGVVLGHPRTSAPSTPQILVNSRASLLSLEATPSSMVADDSHASQRTGHTEPMFFDARSSISDYSLLLRQSEQPSHTRSS